MRIVVQKEHPLAPFGKRGPELPPILIRHVVAEIIDTVDTLARFETLLDEMAQTGVRHDFDVIHDILANRFIQWHCLQLVNGNHHSFLSFSSRTRQ